MRPPASEKRRRMPRTSKPRPAPGDLARVQAFINTTTPAGGDELASPRRLAEWLARWGLLDISVELGEEDLRRTRDLRAGLRSLLFAQMVGREVNASAFSRFQRAAVGVRTDVRLDDDGPAGFASAGGSLDDALGTLLATVAAARLAGQWSLLKLCAREDCGRAFFDLSQSRTGRWCTARCGDRVRAAAYRRSRNSPYR